MNKLIEEFSQNFEVMRVLTYEPKLCTKYELEHLYTIDDFQDFLEIIEAQETLAEEAERVQKLRAAKENNTNKL